jgi:uncharacterized membrane protein
MMIMKIAIAALIVLATFLISAYFYPILPDEVASHWDASGNVNGYMPKFWGLFMVPLISGGILLLFLVIPKIDPLKQNIKKFRGDFDNFIVIIMLFMLFVHILTILWNIGMFVGIGQILSPAFSILLYYSGVLIEKSKRNWFIGIRTPWTLSSDKVWDKTAVLGAKLFKIAGIISLFGLVFPDLFVFFVLVPIILFTFYLFAYSYFEYKKIRKFIR